jgi:hypothetical protein
MLFTVNKYHTWYFNIIHRAQNRASSREEAKALLGYTESHHIIPRSLGGDDSTENKAYLTAREHFICHCLLPKFTKGKDRHRMLAAIVGMKRKRKYQQRYINSKLYETYKKEFAKEQSSMRKGVPTGRKGNGLTGRKQPKSQIEKRSKKLRGRTKTPEEIEKQRKSLMNNGNHKVYADYSKEKQAEISAAISRGLLGKPRSDAHRKAHSISMKGKNLGPKSEATKQKMRKPKSREHSISISIARIEKFEMLRVTAFLLFMSTVI